MRIWIVAACAALCFCAPAYAQDSNGAYWTHERAREPVQAAADQDIARSARSSADLIRAARRYLGSRNPTGFRGPWCGAFMGMIARAAGRSVPPGYLLARDWTRDGPHLRRPAPGAIAVFPHHVGLVERVVGHLIYLISGNHGHRVGEGWYDARRAIAFVRAS